MAQLQGTLPQCCPSFALPCLQDNCITVVTQQTGNLPLQLSLTLAAAVLSIL